MRLLDGELSAEQRRAYEEHVKECEECTKELKDMGRIVELTNELRLRTPDEEFWSSYWRGIYRRVERGTGFLLLIAGLVVVTALVIYEAVTSPAFLTVRGIAISVILLGLVVIFLSVLRERYHESKDDPYKEVKQ
jgi:predicted anti-sigma-YlaC factor YlaD